MTPSRCPFALVLALPLVFGACAPEASSPPPDEPLEADDEDVPFDPADEEPEVPPTLIAIPLTQPVPMRSGAWWGSVATPLENQVWGEIVNATPGKNLTAPYTYRWKCTLPAFPYVRQSLRLSSTSFSVDSRVVRSFSSPTAGAEYSYTIDPAAHGAGWHEIRIRCKAKETTGPETGLVTAITAGFPLQLRGGTSSFQNHSGVDYLDTHGWYDRGVGYAYATFLDVSTLVGKPQSGTISLRLKARVSGDTTLDHFMLKIDGQIATLADGRPAEFHGSTGDRTISIDTRRLSNGAHTFAMHSHGLEKSTSEDPGKQLAAQIELQVVVQN